MKLKTYQYLQENGWNQSPDSSLDSSSTVVMVFGSPDVEAIRTGIDDLVAAYPQSIVVGCSGAGEIYADDVYDSSLSVAVIQFENTGIKQVASSLKDNPDSVQAGKILAGHLASDDLRSVLVLSDGLAVNGSQLVDGLQAALPSGVVITGGLAGDGDRFEKTWLLNCGEICYDHVLALGFYGDSFNVGHGSRGGWDVLGPQREVTRSENNVLFELDGQPALELYKKYLGEMADGLPATGLRFPLAIKNPEEGVDDTVRTILAVDETDQSITFAGDIREGAMVTLMRANFDRLIDGAGDAAAAINTASYHNGPCLAISISCVGRRLVLGPRTEEEIDAALNSFPEGAGHIGFYSYGEISPLASGKCDLHNQTMTITLIWENS